MALLKQDIYYFTLLFSYKILFLAPCKLTSMFLKNSIKH